MSFHPIAIVFIGLVVAMGAVAHFQPQRYARDLRIYSFIFVFSMIIPQIYNHAISGAIGALLDSELPTEHILAATAILREQRVDLTFWLLLSSVFLLYVAGLEWYAKARIKKAEALAVPADTETRLASQNRRSLGHKPPR